MAQAATIASRIEVLREQIARDAPAVLLQVQEAAHEAQGSEARFRTRFAQIIEPWAARLNIPLLVREERTLAKGRADATYNRLIIEYEAPGRLRSNVNHGPTAHAIQQARDYVEGVAQQERQQIQRLIGLAFDGHYFIYVRKVDGHWIEPEVETVNEQSIKRFLRLLVSLTAGKALLPDNLIQDFGSDTLTAQRISRSLYRSLSNTLDSDNPGLVGKLFDQWKIFFGEVTGHGDGAAALRNKPELRRFARGMGIDARNVNPARLFFTVHTYFAVLIKLIAFYALSRFHSGFGNRFGTMYQLGDEELKRELKNLEHGGIFRQLGIRNFLEGDFFKWYLNTWDEDVFYAIRLMLDHLKDYDPGTLEVSPEHARDLLKKLYHRLMPRELRHDLGEYYTPDWLAEHVLNELGYEGQMDKRLLDPACGSGTFLVLAIKRLKERCYQEGLSEQETLEIILNNIVGIDLNPLAAIAARTNYVLALGDLLMHRTRDIDIPVYLADSILTPAAGQELFSQDRYEISTVVGNFDIPSCLKTHEQIDNLCNLLEECVANEIPTDVFIERTRQSLAVEQGDWEGGEGRGDGAAVILTELYNKLAILHEQGLDGIWARILQNAFMPLFLGQFNYIAGNPPWVGWESLPDDYRRKTQPLWIRYGLFPHGGMDTILGKGKKDLSMLMSHVVTDQLLVDGGRLGFVITQTVFKTAGSGQGFRRFRYGVNASEVMKIEHVDDMTDFQPFEAATNRTAVFVWKKGEPTQYPVEYKIWQKTAFREGISQDAPLEEVFNKIRCLDFVAEPVQLDDLTSSWISGMPGSIDSLRHIISISNYRAREGANSGGANGVYWLQTIHTRPDNVLIVQNITAGTRRRVEEVSAEIESALIYPLLRGRDVNRWKINPSLNILISQNPETRRGVELETMQRDYPKTYAYLKRFENTLSQRKDRGTRQIIRNGGAFYSMFGINQGTMSPYKVVWREQASEFTVAAVISKGKPIIPDHKLMMVAVNSPEEAYYLAGMLGNVVSRYIVASYILSISTSTAILNNLAITRWDSENELHCAVCDCSHRLHQAAAEEPLDVLETELDELAARIFGIESDQLSEIQEAYRELTKADLREARKQAEENDFDEDDDSEVEDNDE